MDLGRGTHCVFAFEGVVIFGLQEVPAERVNGPFPEQRRVFCDHDGKMERWKLKKRYVCYDKFNGILDLAIVVMVQNQPIRTGR